MAHSTRILSLTLLTVCTTVAAQSHKIDFSDAGQRLGYSLGNILGNEIKRRNMVLDESVFMRGVEDASSDNTPLVSKEKIHQNTVELDNRVRHSLGLETKNPVKNRWQIQQQKKLGGAAFMRANRQRQGVISRPSGLQYRIIQAGEGLSPELTDSVEIELKMRSIEGQPIGVSTASGESTLMKVDSLIAGLAEAVQLMKPGATWEVYMPPKLAYGKIRRYANTTVIAEIRLLSVF